MIPHSIAARLTQPFSDTQFTPTKFASGQEKAKFANALTRFIASDFPLSGFTRKLYGRLSCSFGHIAHYSRAGFYEHFFEDLQSKVTFLEETLQSPPIGDPAYSFSDVERLVQKRLRACDVLDIYRLARQAEISRRDRALYERLGEKYASTAALVGAAPSVAHAHPQPKRHRRRAEQVAVMDDLFARVHPN